MSRFEKKDSKLRFRAALEKKNRNSRAQSLERDTHGGRKIQESSGKTQKMFRRKSG